MPLRSPELPAMVCEKPVKWHSAGGGHTFAATRYLRGALGPAAWPYF